MSRQHLDRRVACILAYLVPTFAVVQTGGALPAQAKLGSQAPKLQVAQWVRGQPLRLTDAANAVVVFWTPASRSSMDSLPLVGFAVRQFKSVAAIGVADSTPRGAKTNDAIRRLRRRVRFRLALDNENRTRTAYVGDSPTLPSVVLIQRGHIAWVGRPASVYGALTRAFGNPDADYDAALQRVQRRVRLARASRSLEKLRESANELIRRRRSRAEGWSYRLESYGTSAANAKHRKEVLAEALAALSERPEQLSAFVTQLLAGVQLDDEDLARALQALRRIVRRGGGTASVHLCLLLVANRSGRAQLATREASWLAAHVTQDASLPIRCARTLMQSPRRAQYRSLADAISKAMRKLPPRIDALQGAFDFENLYRKDLDAARAAGRRWMKAIASNDSQLNALAWSLLTDAGRKGRFRALALEVATLMGKKSGQKLSFYMLDTLALAQFENGLIDDAIRNQERAIQPVGTNQDYRDRLARYRKAKKMRDRRNRK